MSTDLVEATAREFTPFKPDDVARQVSGRLGREVTIEDIVAVLVDESAVAARSAAATSFRGWDAEIVESWAEKTAAGSVERRELIYSRLGVPSEGYEVLDTQFPREGVPVLIADPDVWTPWYTVERRTAHDFYWRAYKRVLAAQWNDDSAVGKLDVATTNVVSRLADPTRDEPYQSKGLVVGYVQSGKTANFSGVLAKSMDAGYRLIIVLTGTIELLRSQTQRRLDKELIGRQNIGADSDYENDEDWIAHQFLEHEVDPNTSNTVPAIRRLTGADFDFKALGKGLGALHYEFVDHSLPLNHPKNLYPTNIRIAIVKKNSTVLKKLVDDLRKIPTDLAQIPALIIDDEADQASVNTVNPAKFVTEKVERTAINERISDLLALLKRSQYVGYTATPFANVFVDPVDSENIFPKDFILSLERPTPYMGGERLSRFRRRSRRVCEDPAQLQSEGVRAGPARRLGRRFQVRRAATGSGLFRPCRCDEIVSRVQERQKISTPHYACPPVGETG
ncbi:hypothetical protein [Rhodococcus sp. 1168]|uniref:hypothetical protein n=1 Tax=Rhodococcus sp. 1168 TaxID=2018041 RepID=UPI0020CB1C49|nr:hypothetical protein [Rhodococcus sp. 1168]